MEKVVKARKRHKCDQCDGYIEKGEKYMYMEWRDPKISNDYHETQIGIVYERCRLHLPSKNCTWNF